MHKKNQLSSIPLTQEFSLSSAELGRTSGAPGGVITEEAASLSSSKPSPKLARRPSRGGREQLCAEPPACRCTSPPPPPPARRDAGPGSAAAPSMTLTPLASAASLSDGHETQPFPASALEAGAGEVALAVDGHRALCSIGAAGLRWAYDISRCCVPGVRSESVPFEEILAAELLPPRTGMVWVAQPTKVHRLAVYTFRRAPNNPNSWHPRQIVLETPREELLQQWSLTINAAVGQMPRRPRHLLVVINPYGGSRQARALYQSVVRPVFEKAGIKTTVMETQRQGHARTIVTECPVEQLRGMDGVVAVGGDGLFHEVINGLLELRQLSDEKGECAQAMRVGHIPAGSTDAVACSLNGTRSAFTAAMHIALGDGTPLDVLRIDSADGHHEFATCMASYGFMGDLMEVSERYRWLGPKRYDLVGAKMLAHNRAYHVRVSYLPSAHSRGAHSMVCHSGCELCMMEHFPETTVAFRQGSYHSLSRRTREWKVVQGEFAGIMLVIMPCRSDKSAAGVAKYGHLCDGAIHLVLVRRCSRWQYLQFLLSMSRRGLEAGRVGGYIEVIPAEAVKVEPIGKESRWNVDGELLANNHITAEVHRGLVEVFARGVEK